MTSQLLFHLRPELRSPFEVECLRFASMLDSLLNASLLPIEVLHIILKY